MLIVGKHHQVTFSNSFCAKRPHSRLNESSANAAPTMLCGDGQMMEQSAPTIVAAQERPHD